MKKLILIILITIGASSLFAEWTVDDDGIYSSPFIDSYYGDMSQENLKQSMTKIYLDPEESTFNMVVAILNDEGEVDLLKFKNKFSSCTVGTDGKREQKFKVNIVNGGAFKFNPVETFLLARFSDATEKIYFHFTFIGGDIKDLIVVLPSSDAGALAYL